MNYLDTPGWLLQPPLPLQRMEHNLVLAALPDQRRVELVCLH